MTTCAPSLAPLLAPLLLTKVDVTLEDEAADSTIAAALALLRRLPTLAAR